MKVLIKKTFSFRTKYRTLLFLQKFKKPVHFNKEIIEPNKSQAYTFLAADYGNLGDVAITYAQTYFLKKHLPNFQVIEIPISKTLEGLHFVKKNVKKGDIITTVGGGNLGDLYDQIEFIRQLVVEFFPDNKIISFPQTFDFSIEPKGRKALLAAQKIYNRHKDLTFVAREEVSYPLMKRHFDNTKVILTPDIVLSLDRTGERSQRNGVVLCLRNDEEKNLKREESKFILDKINTIYNNIITYDTHISMNNLTAAQRVEELHKIWGIFSSAKLVVTDRLHGMIFCYITNTPCLVFLNNNHKVKGTFRWIRHAKHITLMESFSKESIQNYFEASPNIEEYPYQSLQEKYIPLIKSLQE